MSHIKLVLTDVDGTLVEPEKHEVSDVVRQSIIKAEDAGVQVVAVTGRPFQMAQPVLEVLGFDGYCVVDNGATIHDVVTGDIKWSCWLDVATVRQIVEIVLPFSTAIDYTPGWEEHVPVLESEMELVKEAAPYVFSFFPNEHLSEIETALEKVSGISFHTNERLSDPEQMYVQVNHVNATKFHGVEALRELLGVPKEYSMAIGDGANDVPLFENAGLKVAMGNATDLLKAKANHVVAAQADDGFAEAMERFVLN